MRQIAPSESRHLPPKVTVPDLEKSSAVRKGIRLRTSKISSLPYPTVESVAQATSMTQSSPSVSRKKTSPGKVVPAVAPSGKPSKLMLHFGLSSAWSFQNLPVNFSGSPADNEDQSLGLPKSAVESAQTTTDVSPAAKSAISFSVASITLAPSLPHTNESTEQPAKSAANAPPDKQQTTLRASSISPT